MAEINHKLKMTNQKLNQELLLPFMYLWDLNHLCTVCSYDKVQVRLHFKFYIN